MQIQKKERRVGMEEFDWFNLREGEKHETKDASLEARSFPPSVLLHSDSTISGCRFRLSVFDVAFDDDGALAVNPLCDAAATGRKERGGRKEDGMSGCELREEGGRE